ncbi:cyclic nucleotide-binding domain-containing protein [Singulisphaera sp. Ch08]|uniref:Cyclic nucleotide-binding domain-containing protein n=1 Tax=Singulisphaera sp. Ch08 TaxID=3120278 RepID=A0AAU7CLW1_9BACT
MVKADVAEQFLAAPLLVDVDLDARRALLAILEESHSPANAVLLEQGEPNDHLSFLIEGSAVIERSLPGGRKETLAHLTAPAVFGTTSFFRPTPPTITVRAATDVCILTMGHPAHEKLRRDNPRTAEALALAVVRVLAERFDLLDKRVSDFLAQHADDQPKTTEWSGFRARLFEDSNI